MMNTPGLGSNSVIMGRGAEDLGVNDFFNLLAAQLRNQDMFEPQSNTEFVAQMATFTTLRGIQIIQEHQLSAYAASHVGKFVTVAHTDAAGNITRTEGIVSRVTFYDGEPRLIVNGIAFPLFAVMEVHDPTTRPDEPEEEDSLVGIPNLNAAAGFIGREITLRFRENANSAEYTYVNGVVTGVMKDRNGNILFQLDDGEDYPVEYLVGVRQTAPDAEDGDNGNDGE